jgi:dTDP-4-dehydrorhamnose reductase
MVILLGATGYIGQAFANELRRRGVVFVPLTRKAVDYSDFDILFDYVRRAKPTFLINAAGYTGRPNVDACEKMRSETLHGNVLFPQMVARVCSMTNTPWGHVSSGCIYSGAKVFRNGAYQVETDLSHSQLNSLFINNPRSFSGFTEDDEPNFSFRHPPCSFYSGTKALAEEALRDDNRSYTWRLRIPFDEFDNPRNYLTKVQRYARVYDNINSLSHRGDFVRACLDLWQNEAPFGTYNVTNPGAVTTRQVVALIEKVLKPQRSFEYWKNDREFYTLAAKAPRSNCILDVSKLESAGVQMRRVEDALRSSLEKWQPAPANVEMMSTISESNPVELTLALQSRVEATPLHPTLYS